MDITTCGVLSSTEGGTIPDDDDDSDAGGACCAHWISVVGKLSVLYRGSEPRALLELVTTASSRLSSRSIADWLGLRKLTAGEAPPGTGRSLSGAGIIIIPI